MATRAPSRRRIERVRLTPYKATGVVLAVSAIAFGAAAIARNDAGLAWDVLVGQERPWAGSFWKSACGVILSAVGYALVPTVIGIWIGALVERRARANLQFYNDAVDGLRDYVNTLPPPPAAPRQGP